MKRLSALLLVLPLVSIPSPASLCSATSPRGGGKGGRCPPTAANGAALP